MRNEVVTVNGRDDDCPLFAKKSGIAGALGHRVSRALRPACLLAVALVFGVIANDLCVAQTGNGEREQVIPLKPKASLPGVKRSDLWKDPVFQKRLADQFAESFIAATDIEPRVTEEERKDLQEIQQLITNDETDKAVERLKKELDRNEAASAIYDFMLANVYFQKDNFDGASVAYKSAIEKFDHFRRAWKNLALIYVQQGEFEQALPALTKVVELGGGDSVTYGLLGYAYSSVEEYLPAESAYRMAILLDPATMDWQMGLARSFFKQERYAEAAALCGQLLRENPERTDLWLLQANAYIGLNKPMDAAEVYELVDRLGGSTPDTLNMLGDIYVNEELYELAADSYIKAMEKGSGDSPSLVLRSAKILSARGAMEQTRRLVEKLDSLYGDKLDKDDKKEMLKIQARLAVADGADGEEVEVLQRIVELDPLDGEALILLGQHSAREGDTEKAIFYYERAEGIEGFEADAKVRHAQLLVNTGNYAEALPLLRRAQMVKPRENVQKYLEQVERVAKNR